MVFSEDYSGDKMKELNKQIAALVEAYCKNERVLIEQISISWVNCSTVVEPNFKLDKVKVEYHALSK